MGGLRHVGKDWGALVLFLSKDLGDECFYGFKSEELLGGVCRGEGAH